MLPCVSLLFFVCLVLINWLLPLVLSVYTWFKLHVVSAVSSLLSALWNLSRKAVLQFSADVMFLRERWPAPADRRILWLIPHCNYSTWTPMSDRPGHNSRPLPSALEFHATKHSSEIENWMAAGANHYWSVPASVLKSASCPIQNVFAQTLTGFNTNCSLFRSQRLVIVCIFGDTNGTLNAQEGVLPGLPESNHSSWKCGKTKTSLTQSCLGLIFWKKNLRPLIKGHNCFDLCWENLPLISVWIHFKSIKCKMALVLFLSLSLSVFSVQQFPCMILMMTMINTNFSVYPCKNPQHYFSNAE